MTANAFTLAAAKGKVYAYKPDVVDTRDHIYSAVKLYRIPNAVTPLCKKNRVEDQGNLGSCTGNATTTALEVTLQLANKQLSRLMAYYNARVIEGTVNKDNGAMIRSVIKGLLKTGVCDEMLWQYNISKFNVKPSATAFNDALKTVSLVISRRIVYQRILTLDDVLNAIAAGNPVAFGFSVPISFLYLPASGIQPIPRQFEKIIGGHAVVADGYDLINKFIWVRNSWGGNWGLQGYFKMPFEWFTDSRGLVGDMWVFKK